MEKCEASSHCREAVWNSTLGGKSTLLSVNCQAVSSLAKMAVHLRQTAGTLGCFVWDVDERGGETVTTAVFSAARLPREENSIDTTNDDHKRQANVPAADDGTLRALNTYESPLVVLFFKASLRFHRSSLDSSPHAYLVKVWTPSPVEDVPSMQCPHDYCAKRLFALFSRAGDSSARDVSCRSTSCTSQAMHGSWNSIGEGSEGIYVSIWCWVSCLSTTPGPVALARLEDRLRVADQWRFLEGKNACAIFMLCGVRKELQLHF